MNVYDFDKTIYKKDSSVAFYFFCLRKNPTLLRFLFIQAWYCLLYTLGRISKTRLKEGFFSFLRGIGDTDAAVLRFWEKNIRHINLWYRENHKSNDVVISASPTFLLSPICQQLGICHLIGSEVDKKTGAFLSENCYGEEKPRRFKARFKDTEIERFYSDSLSDAPMARLAKEAFIVKKGRLIPWAEQA